MEIKQEDISSGVEIKKEDIPSGVKIKRITALIAYEIAEEEGKVYLTITEKLFKEFYLKSTITFCNIKEGEVPGETVRRSMKKIGKNVALNFVRCFYWKDKFGFYEVHLYTGSIISTIVIPKEVVAGDITEETLLKVVLNPEVTELSKKCIKDVFVSAKS